METTSAQEIVTAYAKEGVALSVIEEPLPKLSGSIGERLKEAKAQLEASTTIVGSAYWQGAVDAIESYCEGVPMPTTIGQGVTK